MSKFLSYKYKNIKPYVPGEQPQNIDYIKLNTNENPYPPSKEILNIINENNLNSLYKYCDPEVSKLKEAIAKYYKVKKEQIIVGNGSDEILAFAFQAFNDEKKGIAFPNISYGFYKVFSQLYKIKFKEIKLTSDFKININDYFDLDSNIVIANPNAPTGRYLPLEDIVKILENNKNNLVIIDEAYIDFGGESCISLVDKYKNLLVIQTFSKSRSLAGARIGFAIANEEIISDLNKIKFSFNPYNVNQLSSQIAVASINDIDYFNECNQKIIKTREYIVKKLLNLNFTILPSKANFIFVKPLNLDAKLYFSELKKKGILVRYWDKEEISGFVRITIGKEEQMEKLYEITKEILIENKILKEGI